MVDGTWVDDPDWLTSSDSPSLYFPPDDFAPAGNAFELFLEHHHLAETDAGPSVTFLDRTGQAVDAEKVRTTGIAVHIVKQTTSTTTSSST